MVRQSLRRVRITWAFLLVIGALAVTSPLYTVHASPLESDTVAETLSETGTWKPFAASSHQSLGRMNSPYSIIGGGSPCPSNASYSGADSQYSCVDVTSDGSGHAVWTRQGTVDGFGYEHFFAPHNVWMATVSIVVASSAHGILQPNGRYLYGGFHVNADGVIDQYINVIESRNIAPVPDGHEMGVITAYCEGPGESFEQYCPDWVNTTWL